MIGFTAATVHDFGTISFFDNVINHIISNE